MLTPEEQVYLQRKCNICAHDPIELLRAQKPMKLHPLACDLKGKIICEGCKLTLLAANPNCDCPYRCGRKLRVCTQKVSPIEFQITCLPRVKDLTVSPSGAAGGFRASGASDDTGGSGAGGAGGGPTGGSYFELLTVPVEPENSGSWCLTSQWDSISIQLPNDIPDGYEKFVGRNYFFCISLYQFGQDVQLANRANTVFTPFYLQSAANVLSTFVQIVNSMANKCNGLPGRKQFCLELVRHATEFEAQFAAHYRRLVDENSRGNRV